MKFKPLNRLAVWWHCRRDPVCRIIDLAQELSSEELRDMSLYFAVLDELTKENKELGS